MISQLATIRSHPTRRQMRQRAVASARSPLTSASTCAPLGNADARGDLPDSSRTDQVGTDPNRATAPADTPPIGDDVDSDEQLVPRDAERSIARICIEDASYFAFKRTLTRNPAGAFTVFLAAAVFLLTVPAIVSRLLDPAVARQSAHRTAMITSDMGLQVLVQGSLVTLMTALFVAEHGARSGRWAWAQSLADRLRTSEAASHVAGFFCIVTTLRVSLQLLWYTTLSACVAPPVFTASIPDCNPAGMGLPSDRVALAFALPVLVLVFMPGVRMWAALLSWLIGCVCMALAYARIGVLVDRYNVLNVLVALYTLVKVDAFMWSAYQLHCGTVHQAARREAAARRTRALEVALAEAEKGALEASAADLRALMGNVAHDLKTPIHAISAGVELLRHECDRMHPRDQSPSAAASAAPPESVRHLIDTIWASCEFMAMAVNRAVDFTKAGHNGAALQATLETVCISSQAEVPLRIIRQLYAGSAISFAPLPPGMSVCVITDRHWFGENLLCLLSNAAKYSDGGAIHVAVSLRSSTAESPVSLNTPSMHVEARRVRVTVTDGGIGVPLDLRARLFQPFARAQRMAGGTGLGLFSMRKRMDALGGACGVDGRADGARGSEFWFEFPYRPDESASTDASALSASLSPLMPATLTARESPASGAGGSVSPGALNQPRGSSAPVQPLRILLVEDSPFIVKLTVRMLAARGHEVESALNGSEGLKRLAAVMGTAHDFDLVLCDFQMPVMDGFEMVRRYRFLEAEHGRRVESNIGLGGAIGTCASASDSSEPESMSGSGTQSEPLSARVRSRSRPPMAILGISANSDLVAQSMATDAGMNAFVSKPFTLADLASAVALVLSKSL